MSDRKTTIASAALIIAVGAALSGCSIVGNVLDQVTGGSTIDDSSVFSIKVGDCFTEPDTDSDGMVSEIEAIECALAHDDEAYASVLMSDAEFPGDAATQAQAEDACLPRFLDFVGATSNYEGSLYYSFFYPSTESWDGGDREILCYAYDEDGTTTGSLKDSAS
jgi:Septum formation